MNKHFYTGLGSKSYRLATVILFIAGCVFLLSSCITSKKSYYFQTLTKDTTLTGLISKDLESKISKGDNLRVQITSLSKEEDILFNIPNAGGSGLNETGFLVNADGTILVHKLGKINAIGLTRKELALSLQKSLEPFLKDPIVTVQYLNHKITVMGEVERPQVINMVEEQLSVIDALVLCGDAKQNARRDHIMIIREEQNEKKVKILNMQDHSIFSSSWYYLQPNDIVYVLPDEEKRQKEERRARFQQNFAIASASISLLVIILDRILR